MYVCMCVRNIDKIYTIFIYVYIYIYVLLP